jgi:hypothetical protein
VALRAHEPRPTRNLEFKVTVGTFAPSETTTLLPSRKNVSECVLEKCHDRAHGHAHARGQDNSIEDVTLEAIPIKVAEMAIMTEIRACAGHGHGQVPLALIGVWLMATIVVIINVRLEVARVVAAPDELAATNIPVHMRHLHTGIVSEAVVEAESVEEIEAEIEVEIEVETDTEIEEIETETRIVASVVEIILNGIQHQTRRDRVHPRHPVLAEIGVETLGLALIMMHKVNQLVVDGRMPSNQLVSF